MHTQTHTFTNTITPMQMHADLYSCMHFCMPMFQLNGLHQCSIQCFNASLWPLHSWCPRHVYLASPRQNQNRGAPCCKSERACRCVYANDSALSACRPYTNLGACWFGSWMGNDGGKDKNRNEHCELKRDEWC